MRTLDKIQKAVRFFKKINQIAVVVCILNFLMCLALSILCVIFPHGVISKTLTEYLGRGSTDHTVSFFIAEFIASIVLFILLFHIHHYLSDELKAGTPFTFKGAKQLRIIGIKTIIEPIIAVAVDAAINLAFGIEDPVTFDNSILIVFGICLILMSLIIKYGAEIESDLKEKEPVLKNEA